jgi:hypothetical protein
MWNPDIDTAVAHAHYQDLLAEGQHARLVAHARGQRTALGRRVADPLGRALLHLGNALLRYSCDGSATGVYTRSPLA